MRFTVAALVAAGGWRFARGLAIGLGASRADTTRELQQGIFAQLGDFELGSQIVDARLRSGAIDAYGAGLFAADSALAAGDPSRSWAILDGDRRPNDASWQRRAVAALARLGRPELILNVLDCSVDALPVAEAASARFDAYWLLGNVAKAIEEVSGPDLLATRDLGVTSRLWRGVQAGGASPDEARRTILAIEDSRALEPDAGWMTRVRADLGLVDEIAETAYDASCVRELGPTAAMSVASAHYVRRDFTSARAITAALHGTRVHRAAEKLESRLLLEEGRYAEAFDHRAQRRRPNEELDEVAYFAALHLGRHEEAFAMYVPRSDRLRLVAEFGDAAEEAAAEVVASRFVITQNGPGDEILHASTYPVLRQRSGVLRVSCEPRLEPLLRRSFPDVEFFPAERLPSNPRPGFLAHGRPPRAAGVFFDLLSMEGLQAACRSDRVILGRSLPRLAPSAVPAAPYLVPDADLVESARSRLRHSPIGLVWRSEFASAIRGIHYLRPSDLLPLTSLDSSFICLQHDVTDDEREDMRRTFGDRIDFIDDVDLRDDFDSTLGVLAACRAVVGVTTTMVELAAAGGVPTITLYPNRMGAWRKRSDGVSDYWHRTMRVAVATDLERAATCAEAARDLLSAEG